MKSWHRFYDPGTGRYISADPIGLLGGLNLYAYVQNDPVNAVDPWGLADYKAFCRYIAGGEDIGGGVLKCKIEGPCNRNNKKEIWLTKTILVGFTAGLPGGITYFPTVFHDDLNDLEPFDGTEFLGASHYYSVGGAIPGHGGSYSDIKLGELSTKGTGSQTGVDFSADIFWGYTFMNNDVVINNWEEDCCYGQD